MRRASIIAALLTLVFAGSSFGCITGWSSATAPSCRGSKAGSCSKRRATLKAGDCRASLVKAGPGGCSLRGFVQFQFVEVSRFESRNPLVRRRTSVRAQTATLLLTSTGSPESDRGPPRS